MARTAARAALAATLVWPAAICAQPSLDRQEQAVEVEVRGEHAEPGATRVTREEARALPGAFGDPLRAVEAMPGVTPIVSGLPYFFVRGAPPANVGFFVDGVDVPLLYHAFFGPAVLHPGLIDNVELHAGAPPVRFGRFAGPIVEAELRDFRGELNGQASARVIDAGALVEAPFARGSGDILLAGRYSYAGLLLSLFSDDRLAYWDYQGLASYRLGSHDSLSVFSFGARDVFDPADPNVARNAGIDTEFHRLDVRWDSQPDHRTNTRLAATLGADRTTGEENTLSDRSLRVRSETTYRIDTDAELALGADARLDDFDLESDPSHASYANLVVLFPDRTEHTLGAYAALWLRPVPEIVVIPGLRADAYMTEADGAVGVDPRLSSEFRLSPWVTVEHSLGLMHQRPNFVPQVPAAQVGSLQGGLQMAVVQSSGVRTKLPANLTAQASVFRSVLFDAVNPIGTARDFEIDRVSVKERTTVSTVGLELKLSRPLTRKLGGFVGYTLSRSQWSRDRVESIAGFDRTHVLQAALAYHFGAGISAGVRSVFYSGIPARIIGGREPHFVSDKRGSAFLRIDARAEKRWRLGERGYVAAIVEVLNATASSEVLKLDCGAICRETRTAPVILPSVGVEIGF